MFSSKGPLIVMVICNVAVGMRRRSADQQEGISIDKEFIESLRGKTFKECEPNQFIESSSIQFEDDRDREYPKAKLTLKLKASLRQNYTELLKTPFFPVVPGKVQNHWVIELPPQRPAVGLGEGDKGGGMEAFYAKLYKYTYHNADKAFSVDITSLDRVPVAIITIGKEPKNVVWKKIALVEEKPVIGKKRQSECVVS
ncbi:hypothetical protein FOL47_005931 [Perkinsus chesapeaki]|uniref:Uncharacterized protein n=1 Tax=Perkinsus chesapeaki TaxID=330153 RepID=A0A7J6LUS6_PERCH|nr:hypothetical protein FOL47_005931 [Perkinsus chesapeaki]